MADPVSFPCLDCSASRSRAHGNTRNGGVAFMLAGELFVQNDLLSELRGTGSTLALW